MIDDGAKVYKEDFSGSGWRLKTTPMRRFDAVRWKQATREAADPTAMNEVSVLIRFFYQCPVKVLLPVLHLAAGNSGIALSVYQT